MFTTIFLALGVAADACAVSASTGIQRKNTSYKQVITMASFFGFFQFIMPLIGWVLGVGFTSLIQNVDHWVAFGILGFLGGKMIWESLNGGEEEVQKPFTLYNVLVLAVATSIDALAIGLSVSFLQQSIFQTALAIGVVTFLLSIAGFWLGKKFGHLFENKVEIAGGLILILIGCKILGEHLGLFHLF